MNCRIDHYQTQDQVHVSVFARQVDKERSTVNFDENEVSIDQYLIVLYFNVWNPGHRRLIPSRFQEMSSGIETLWPN